MTGKIRITMRLQERIPRSKLFFASILVLLVLSLTVMSAWLNLGHFREFVVQYDGKGLAELRSGLTPASDMGWMEGGQAASTEGLLAPLISKAENHIIANAVLMAGLFGALFGFLLLLLSKSLNHLRIQSEEIAGKNAKLKEVEAALSLSAEQLSEASVYKSEFIANISHEIRTPLNSLLGLAQVLERSSLDESQLDMVHQMSLVGRILLNHVSDILDYSSMELGQIDLDYQPFDLIRVLENLRDLMYGSASSQGLRFSLKIPDGETLDLIGDPVRLSQVLMNLFNNAVKFTEYGQIVVEIVRLDVVDDPENCRLRFSISDTGIGIPESKQSMLFMPFTQADGSATRRHGGTGLGLSICKNLVELMGGEIGVNSQEDQGSTFWFELPFKLVDAKKFSETSVVPPLSASQNLAGRHVLVVDDSEMNRMVIKRMLQLENVTTTLVENGQHAVNLLALQPEFDAVLMDVQMPVMGGLEAIRLIRQDLGLIDLPILACSASVRQEEQENAMIAGADDFICKPIDLNILFAKLGKLLGSSQS